MPSQGKSYPDSGSDCASGDPAQQEQNGSTNSSSNFAHSTNNNESEQTSSDLPQSAVPSSQTPPVAVTQPQQEHQQQRAAGSSISSSDLAPATASTSMSVYASASTASTNTNPLPVQSEVPSSQTVPPALGVDDALMYIQKIKIRFLDQRHKYEEFTGLMEKYRDEKAEIKKKKLPKSPFYWNQDDVYLKLKKLFENNEDLLEEFVKYMTNSEIHQKKDEPDDTDEW